MADIQIRTLTEEDFTELHECWITAFGDYQVKIDMPPSLLKEMFAQNGLVYEVSVAAYKDNKMIGFLLNGMRTYDGVVTGYDTGTALIPEFRGAGISSKLFPEAEKTLIKRGMKNYLLEVIQTNEPAYRVYLKNGFKVTRELIVFQIENLTSKAFDSRIEIKEERYSKELTNLLEYKPSWQNSFDAISAMGRGTITYVAREKNQPVGYITFQRSRRRILQIGAKEIPNKKEIYAALLSQGANEELGGKDIRAVNIPTDAKDLIASFEACGFTTMLSQYEMAKGY
jgi:ribosomal protein S18 acetylase RimI-like enzyme